MRRTILLVLVAVLATAGAGAVLAAGQGGSTAFVRRVVEVADSPRDGPPTGPRTRHCSGIGYDDVHGPRPTYSRNGLARFAGDGTVCRALWLPRPRARLVPQAMALDRGTAWVVGYSAGARGHRPCRVLHVDLRTGRRLAYQPRIVGAVGSRPVRYCRHGGGVALRAGRLWIVEKGKLWLVDPARIGHSPDALRVWRIHPPVRGSAVIATPRRLGIVPFARGGHPRVEWYSFRDLLARRATDLVVSSTRPHEVAPRSSTPVPTYVQGALLAPTGRLYLTRSSTRCGELLRRDGRRIAFIPGAEQIALGPHGQRLWAVSESGARPFQVRGQPRPLTPALTSFAWPRVLHGPPTRCHFS